MTKNVETFTKKWEPEKAGNSFISALEKTVPVIAQFLNRNLPEVDPELSVEDCILGLPKDLSPEEMENFEKDVFAKRLVFGNPELAQHTKTSDRKQQEEIEGIFDGDEDLLRANSEKYAAQYGEPTLPRKLPEDIKSGLRDLREKMKQGREIAKGAAIGAAGALIMSQGGSEVQNLNSLNIEVDFTQKTTEVFQRQEVLDQEAFLMKRLKFLADNFNTRVEERRSEMENINTNPYIADFLQEIKDFKKAGEAFRQETLETYNQLQIPGVQYPGGIEAKIAEMKKLIVLLNIFNTTYFPGANLGMLQDYFAKSMNIDKGMLYWMKVILYQGRDSNASKRFLPLLNKEDKRQRAAFAIGHYLKVELPRSQNPQIARDLHNYSKDSQIFTFISTAGRVLEEMLKQNLIPVGATVVCANLNVSDGILELMKSRKDLNFLIINAKTDKTLEVANILNTVDEANKLRDQIALNPVLAGVTQLYKSVLNPHAELLGSRNFPFRVSENIFYMEYLAGHGAFFSNLDLFWNSTTAVSKLHNKDFQALEKLEKELLTPVVNQLKK